MSGSANAKFVWPQCPCLALPDHLHMHLLCHRLLRSSFNLNKALKSAKDLLLQTLVVRRLQPSPLPTAVDARFSSSLSFSAYSTTHLRERPPDIFPEQDFIVFKPLLCGTSSSPPQSSSMPSKSHL
ncbi:hypothetical protein GOP47_0024210 [Adiantum capillus-veneris]|uniref:Uncharacterized protein n=1 Tax=Adiantum capillus-veneris TaxID=13818 RepID=A0A9D4Z5C1_ADICA|nr:hypothetical protein GOP47_0024210 [Adiantum capillus-veneris]